MEVFGTLLGSGIQGQIVGSYHARMTNGCYVSNETLPNTSTYSLTDSLENTVRAGPSAPLLLPRALGQALLAVLPALCVVPALSLCTVSRFPA